MFNAAGRADKHKRDRYPGNAGKQVTPCSVETFGHVSPIFMEVIARLASLAAQRQRARGINSTEWLRRMKIQFGFALAPVSQLAFCMLALEGKI